MSKVKIQGNASGTGVLTVTAPNTSTDRTLTLPDSTGTLLTTDGDGSNLTGISSVGGATGVDFNDNVKARFGTGNDLEIYHNGTQSILYDSSDINLETETNILMKRQSGGGATMFKAVVDGTVELYHDNTKKLETTATGIAVSGGVAIGGTGTANTLDDYEEGTFTGTFKDSSGANMNGAVYTTYTKIGNLCTITVYNASWSDVQNGNLEQMTGLPFTAAASVRTVGSLGSYGAPLQDYAQFPVIYPNASSVQFKGSRDNNSWVSHWDTDSNSEFMWTMTYKTA